MALSSVDLQAGGGLWSQIQQQFAERNAVQAEQRARALQSQARQAQGEADRAQENARSLKQQSTQAQGEAEQARRSLSAIGSIGEVQAGFSALRTQIGEVLAGTEKTPAPVVNAYGETTGTRVNVTA
jgi:chromosome segregation ATPase